uniref:Uncharacterized protein n=1 Tax=Hanusia phi TaxID=3032 RepID=A0A7S0HYR1_9CRYP
MNNVPTFSSTSGYSYRSQRAGSVPSFHSAMQDNINYSTLPSAPLFSSGHEVFDAEYWPRNLQKRSFFDNKGKVFGDDANLLDAMQLRRYVDRKFRASQQLDVFHSNLFDDPALLGDRFTSQPDTFESLEGKLSLALQMLRECMKEKEKMSMELHNGISNESRMTIQRDKEQVERELIISKNSLDELLKEAQYLRSELKKKTFSSDSRRIVTRINTQGSGWDSQKEEIFVKNLAGIAGISEEDVHILESDGAGLLHLILDMKEDQLGELMTKIRKEMSDPSSFLMRALKIEWIRPPESLRLTEAEKTIQQLRMQLMQKEHEQKDDRERLEKALSREKGLQSNLEEVIRASKNQADLLAQSTAKQEELERRLHAELKHSTEMKSFLNEVNPSKLQKMEQDMFQKLDYETKRAQHYEEECKRLAGENKKLLQAARESKSLDQTIEDHKQRRESLIKDNSYMQNRIDSLEAQLQEKMRELTDADRMIAELRREKDENERKIKGLQDKIEEQEVELRSKNSSVTSQTRQINLLSSKLQSLEEDKKEYQRSDYSKSRKLEHDLENCATKLAEKESIISDMDREISKLKELVRLKTTAAYNASADADKLRDENEKMHEALAKGGLDKLNKDKEAYMTEIEELKTKNRALLNRLIDIDDQK